MQLEKKQSFTTTRREHEVLCQVLSTSEDLKLHTSDDVNGGGLMTNKALSKIWGFLALATLTLCALFTLRLRGEAAKAEISGWFEHKSTEIAVIAVPVVMPLLLALFALTVLWARRHSAARWPYRVPIFYFDDTEIHPSERAGKVYQGVVLVFGVVIPFVLGCLIFAGLLNGAVHEPLKSKTGRVVLTGQLVGLPDQGQAGVWVVNSGSLTTKDEEISGSKEVIYRNEPKKHFDYRRLSAMSGLRFGEKGGPTYHASYPWIASVFFAVVCGLWLCAIWFIVRPARSS